MKKQFIILIIASIFFLICPFNSLFSQSFYFSKRSTVSANISDWDLHQQVVLHYNDTVNQTVIFKSYLINSIGYSFINE